jgi:hypothetical protein
VESFCEDDNEFFGLHNRRGILDCMNDYQLLNEDPAWCIYMFMPECLLFLSFSCCQVTARKGIDSNEQASS